MRSDIGRLIGLGLVLTVFSGLTLTTILLAGANFLVIGIFAALAWLLIAMLFDEGRQPKRRTISPEAAKLKRQDARPASDAELIARLLDPEDIAEIKDAIRARLLDTVDRDGEVVGLEELLDSQRRRRGSR
jgi:hypothetical protein